MPRENQEGSLTAEQLLGSAWNVFNLTIHDGQKNWQEMGEDFQEAFAAVIQRITGIVEDAEGGSIKGTAAQAYVLCQQAMGNEHFPDFAELSLKQQLAWEAVVRHMINLLGGFDPSEDGSFDEHETYWPSWLQQKLAEAKLPEREKGGEE